MNRQQRRHPERHTPVPIIGDRSGEKVAVTYAHPSDVSAKFHRSLFRLGVLDAYGAVTSDGRTVGGHGRIGGGGAHIPLQSGAVIARARNRMVRDFLPLNGIEWLWMCDSDMTFDPDLLERLLAAAHPKDRPIVGGLCFSFMADRPRKFAPTLYSFVPGTERLVRLTQYPADTLVPVAATGAACLLIHRTVLESMAKRFPPPRPWFDETPFYERDEQGEPILSTGDEYSEDLTFCLRAQACGFPIYVHTGIKLGHVKEFEADEESFLTEAATVREACVPRLPTFVVIPVKAGERDGMTAALVDTLAEQVPADCIRVDDTDATITDKWNAGLVWAAGQAAGMPHNVAVLNNDLEVPLEFLARLEAGMRQDPDAWISYPNVHGAEIPNGEAVQFDNPSLAGQTLSGFAFMLRGEAGLRFDPLFRWWYGDSDIEKQVRAAGKRAVCVGGCFVRHLHPMESSRSPQMVKVIREDERRFAEKWGLDAASLWLAQHPEFGSQPVSI